jgi:hypothetical protein
VQGRRRLLDQAVGHPQGRARHRHGDRQRAGQADRHAADADLVLPLVDRVAAGADQRDLRLQGALVGDGGGGLRGERRAGDQPGGLGRADGGQQGLADPGAVQLDPVADLGEGAHAVPARDLGHVLGPVLGQHGEVGRLAGQLGQPAQHRQGPLAEQRVGLRPERDQARAQAVAAVRGMTQVAAAGQRAGEPVHGRRRQSQGRGEVAQARGAAGGGDRLKHVEGPLHRLHTALGGLGLGLGKAHVSPPPRYLPTCCRTGLTAARQSAYRRIIPSCDSRISRYEI